MPSRANLFERTFWPFILGFASYSKTQLRLGCYYRLRETDVGVWRSLVAHLLWEQGVEGSNPFAPTNSTFKKIAGE